MRARPPSYSKRAARGERRCPLASSLFALSSLALACGSPAPPEAQAEPSEPPALEDAWTVDVPRLRAGALALGGRAAEHAGTPEGVAEARAAAALARVLSIRDPEADWVSRARAWLTEASRARDLEGACEASLELARLEARDAADPDAAYRAAYRAERRFAADEACAAEARALRGPLESWRPASAVLRAIDAEVEEREVEEPAAGTSSASAAAWAAERASEESARLDALTLFSAAGSGDEQARAARVVLRFDRVVAFEHGEAPASGGEPRRTWLELPGVSAAESVVNETPVGSGGLRHVELTRREGSARVTFALDDDARFRVFVLPDPFRVVFDVERGGPRAEGPVRRIVLDAGHGGDEFGARAFGMRESDLTLDLARRVRTLLMRRLPDVEVVMTREEDVVVSLEQRAAMANAIDADLFLSIHLNAADDAVDRGGVTTFVLDTSDDLQARRLAARENGTGLAQVDSLTQLMASLHREEQLRASRALADQVHRGTLSAGRRILPTLHDRGVKAAVFYVLVGARMPAVLLEASFLSREQEAMALRTTDYRQALAEGIAEGLVRYCGR